jgi:signal transduction histidine kinase
MNVSSAFAEFSPHSDHGSKALEEERNRKPRKTATTEHRSASAYYPITHRLLASRLFPGTWRRFLLRLAGVSTGLQKVHAAWKGVLSELALTPEAEKALSELDVETLYGYLQSGDLHAYEYALARLGQDLAERNVPEEYATAALGLFFEICLCALLGEARDDKECALGLSRLASVSQLFLASGYANCRTAGMRVVEQRLQKAEDRAEALAISVIEANEKERRRLSSDLHDEIGHDLVVLKLYLEMIIADVKPDTNGEVRKRLAEAISLSTRAIDAVRRLAFDLGPGIFDECGFIPAIRNYARRFSATTGLKATVRVARSDPRLQSRDELALYRVLQGSLSNVLKHSRAKAVSIEVKGDAHSVFMSVDDNGRGFNVARKLRDSSASFGLQTMRERIELLGGSFQIRSSVAQAGRKHHGTRIEVVLPLTRPEEK